MTSLSFLQSKKILQKVKNSHPQFLNHAFVDPYAGCEYGCVYCYGVRENIIANKKEPSPFRVCVKTSCAFALKNELADFSPDKDVFENFPALKHNESGKNFSVGLGYESEPYQKCEEQFQLTRNCIEIFKEEKIPFQIITKSDLILRDIKIISELSQNGLAIVTVSLFTLNKKLASVFEPKVLPAQKRLDLIKELRRENIVCGAALMPIFPYLSDSEDDLEKLFSALHSHGALYCVPGILSLDQPVVRERIFKVLDQKFPEYCDRYNALYDKLGCPALNYCGRIETILKNLSEKYQIPTILPVNGFMKKNSLIVKSS